MPGQLSEWGPNFDLAYYDGDTTLHYSAAYFNPTGIYYKGFQQIVNFLTNPEYGGIQQQGFYYNSGFDRYECSQCDHPFPGYLYGAADTQSVLLADIKLGLAKSLYINGHGTPDYIGDYFGNGVKASFVGAQLGNSYLLNGTAQFNNPMRFVFLDACATAAGSQWSTAFGILPLEPAVANKGLLGPQAFVGWQKDKTVPADGPDAAYLQTAYIYTMFIFYQDWMNGVPLTSCIEHASTPSPTLCFPLPVPTVQSLGCGSSGLGGVYGGDGKVVPNIYPSEIYVIGHSGLTIDGVEDAYDKCFTPPSNWH